MKRFRRYMIFIIAVIMTLSLAACSSKKEASTASNAAYDMDGSKTTGTASFTSKTKMDSGTSAATSWEAPAPASDTVGKLPQEATSPQAASGDNTNGTALTSTYPLKSNSSPTEKIIRNINMDVEIETDKFNGLIQDIDQKIAQLGGYVESSNLSGKRLYSDANRSGYIVARIPKDKIDEFVNVVKDSSNVVNEAESSRNVTLEYIDTESRKKALEIEQERLFAILEKAEKLEDIVTLESRLSSIRYELQSYETQLRTYDNQVEYGTVTLQVTEVERITPVAKEKVTFADKIKNGLSDTFYNIGEGLKNFVVWFVVNLPYLIIWAAIIFAVVLIIRKSYKRYYKKNYPAPGTEQKNPPDNHGEQ